MGAKTEILYTKGKVNSGRKDKKGNMLTQTLYFFYPNGVWDEERRTKEDAQKAYPDSKFIWVFDKG